MAGTGSVRSMQLSTNITNTHVRTSRHNFAKCWRVELIKRILISSSLPPFPSQAPRYAVNAVYTQTRHMSSGTEAGAPLPYVCVCVHVLMCGATTASPHANILNTSGAHKYCECRCTCVQNHPPPPLSLSPPPGNRPPGQVSVNIAVYIRGRARTAGA